MAAPVVGRCRPAVGAGVDPARDVSVCRVRPGPAARRKLNKIPGVRVRQLRNLRRDHRCQHGSRELCGVVEKAGYHAAPHTETTVLDNGQRIPTAPRPRLLGPGGC